MTLAECDPGFQADMERLATSFHHSVEEIWKRWQEYEQTSDGWGQSALVSEFEKSLG